MQRKSYRDRHKDKGTDRWTNGGEEIQIDKEENNQTVGIKTKKVRKSCKQRQINRQK